MKNCDEMVNSLLERRDRYDAEKKRKKTIVTSTVTSVCCVCLVALLGVGMWKGGVLKMPLSEQTPGISEKSQNNNYNNIADSNEQNDNSISINSLENTKTEDDMKVYYVKSISQGDNCEVAADMYRPEGYNENIGSALALMMSIHENADFKFSVIMRIPQNSNLEEMLKKVHDTAAIDISEPICVRVEGVTNTLNQYYCLLTAKQIVALAENGTKCFYVGSGSGDYADINWDTKKGIETYCELNGDMYVSCNGKTEYSPDIEVEP